MTFSSISLYFIEESKIMIKNIQILFFLLIISILSGCAHDTCKLNQTESQLPTNALWLANASAVDFEELDELQCQLNEPCGSVSRYEGFFGNYREGIFKIPENLQNGKCLSPEAEWMFYFSDPSQINFIIKDGKEPTDEQISKLKIEVRGMIEGKWLDVLRDEARKPKWIQASGDNNVVTSPINNKKIELTIEELDEKLLDGSLYPRIEIYRIQSGREHQRYQDMIYFSSLTDLTTSELFKGLRESSSKPVLVIVKSVISNFSRYKSKMDSDSVLRGINLSANGPHAALVNNPFRRELAREAPICKKAWYILRYFRIDQSRIGMRLITNRALKEETNCLQKGEEYVMYLFNNQRELIGKSRLSLE
jgi:hypothetical protein